MNALRIEHNIISSNITGFEPVTGNVKELSDHPGFKHIVHLLNHHRDELRSWMIKGDIQSYRHGVLWKHFEQSDPNFMTRNQLITRVKQLTHLAEELNTVKPAFEALTAAYRALERELAATKTQNIEFLTQLREKVEECGELKTRLIQLGESAD